VSITLLCFIKEDMVGLNHFVLLLIAAFYQAIQVIFIVICYQVAFSCPDQTRLNYLLYSLYIFSKICFITYEATFPETANIYYNEIYFNYFLLILDHYFHCFYSYYDLTFFHRQFYLNAPSPIFI
jgi:hypothetical protein